MAEKKQNLVEEALLQMKNLEEAVTENAKGILASTMKEEISELVKESLSEEDFEEVEMEESAAEKMEGEEMEEGEDKMDHEMKEQEELVMMDVEDDEVEDEMEDEMGDMEDMDNMEDEMDSDEMLSMMDLPGDDMEVDDEEEILLPLDLTDASDEEVLKVFKAMGEEDGIVVTQDGDEIHLKDEEADVEYQIQTEGDKEEEVIADEEEMEGEYKEGYEMEEEDEVVYEIELGEEEEVEDEESEEVEDESEEEMKEDSKKHEYRRKKVDGVEKRAGEGPEGHFKDYEMEEGEEMEGEYKESSIQSNVNGRALNKKPQGFPKSLKRPAQRNEALEKEVAQLREKNEEYRKALNIFKEKLNEVAVFNSNLAYATRLFTEHSTTKQEKINILRRFDSAETIKESKGLYKIIKEDLDSKENTTVVTESVSAKVQKSPSKGSATNLIESKTYENPQFLRMKDLMGKLQK